MRTSLTYLFKKNMINAKSKEESYKTKRSFLWSWSDLQFFGIRGVVGRQQGHDFRVTDLVHDKKGKHSDEGSDDGHQSEVEPEGNLNK